MTTEQINKAAEEYVASLHKFDRDFPIRHFRAGADFALSHSRQEIEELKAKHQVELSNYAYQIEMAKRERDKAEAENAKLREALNFPAKKSEQLFWLCTAALRLMDNEQTQSFITWAKSYETKNVHDSPSS